MHLVGSLEHNGGSLVYVVFEGQYALPSWKKIITIPSNISSMTSEHLVVTTMRRLHNCSAVEI
jgi:hypothetical protein